MGFVYIPLPTKIYIKKYIKKYIKCSKVNSYKENAPAGQIEKKNFKVLFDFYLCNERKCKNIFVGQMTDKIGMCHTS